MPDSWELGRVETQAQPPGDDMLVMLVNPQTGTNPAMREVGNFRDDLATAAAPGELTATPHRYQTSQAEQTTTIGIQAIAEPSNFLSNLVASTDRVTVAAGTYVVIAGFDIYAASTGSAQYTGNERHDVYLEADAGVAGFTAVPMPGAYARTIAPTDGGIGSTNNEHRAAMMFVPAGGASVRFRLRYRTGPASPYPYLGVSNLTLFAAGGRGPKGDPADPADEGLPIWSAKDWPADSVVVHLGHIWLRLSPTLSDHAEPTIDNPAWRRVGYQTPVAAWAAAGQDAPVEAAAWAAAGQSAPAEPKNWATEGSTLTVPNGSLLLDPRWIWTDTTRGDRVALHVANETATLVAATDDRAGLLSAALRAKLAGLSMSNPRGPWAEGTAYAVRDVVYDYNPATGITTVAEAGQAHVAAVSNRPDPEADSARWRRLAVVDQSPHARTTEALDARIAAAVPAASLIGDRTWPSSVGTDGQWTQPSHHSGSGTAEPLEIPAGASQIAIVANYGGGVAHDGPLLWSPRSQLATGRVAGSTAAAPQKLAYPLWAADDTVAVVSSGWGLDAQNRLLWLKEDRTSALHVRVWGLA